MASPDAQAAHVAVKNVWDYDPSPVDKVFDFLTGFDAFTPFAAVYMTLVHGHAYFVAPSQAGWTWGKIESILTPQGLPKDVAKQVRIRLHWRQDRKGKMTFNVAGHRRAQAKAMMRAEGLPFRETLLSCIFARDTRPQEKRRRAPRKRSLLERMTGLAERFADAM